MIDQTGPLVGLIPAAGFSRRLPGIPWSKEVAPLGAAPGPDGVDRIRVACDGLLDAFRRAGVETAFVVLRDGKWDVPTFLGRGRAQGITLAYLVTDPNRGPAFTVNRAGPFLDGARVAFGFPDLQVTPPDALARVAHHQSATGADLCLGLVPAPEPGQDEMVAVEGDRPVAIEFYPGTTDLSYTWVQAVWSPVFTRFLDGYLADGDAGGARTGEVKLGHAVQAALDAGLHVRSVAFPDGSCLDVGTPRDLARALGALARGTSPFHDPEGGHPWPRA